MKQWEQLLMSQGIDVPINSTSWIATEKTGTGTRLVDFKVLDPNTSGLPENNGYFTITVDDQRPLT
jgi:hypothetical protein